MKCYLLVLALAAACVAEARTYYVSAGATGAGSSWADATGDLRAALALATAGDEVWVSAGTYAPTACSPCTPQERALAFELAPGVLLRGGFAGTEASADDRPRPLDRTLSVLTGAIDAATDTVGSYTVVRALNPDGALLEGFTLRGGIADDFSAGAPVEWSSGGLLYASHLLVDGEIDLAVRDCRFEGGEALRYGGALYVEGSFGRTTRLRIERADFVGCSAGRAGGAVAVSSAFGGVGGWQLADCSFRDNASGEEGGGAVWLNAAEGGARTDTLRRVEFVGNESLGSGGALRLYGKSGNCSPLITDATFADNKGHFGGALNADGTYSGQSHPRLRRVTFARNESVVAGGAIFTYALDSGRADLDVLDGDFFDNYSGESGGAVLVNAIGGESYPRYQNCRFERNEAFFYGGALYNLGRSGICNPVLINCLIAGNTGSSAGGMYCLGSVGGECNPVILNSAFVGNSANIGGGLYSNANDSTGTCEPYVVNTVFHDNRAPFGKTLRIIQATPRFLNCSFDTTDCEALYSGVGGGQECLGGNLFGVADPFVDYAGEDYRPAAASPLIDAGTTDEVANAGVYADLLNDFRVRGSGVDIGPYEDPSGAPFWTEDLLDAQVTLCADDSLRLTPAFFPEYPATYAWSLDGELVADTEALGPIGSPRGGTYRLVATYRGETLTREVAVDVTETVVTSLTPAPSNAEQVCRDSVARLAVDVSADGNPFEVVWKDINGSIVSESVDYSFTPMTVGDREFSVEVRFLADCVDAPLRAVRVATEVLECMDSGAQGAKPQALYVAPNPVRTQLSFRIAQAAPGTTYSLYSSTGQRIRSGAVLESDTSVNVADLMPGVYQITVRGGRARYRSSFVKL